MKTFTIITYIRNPKFFEMSLQNNIMTAMKTAMKSKDTVALTALRSIKSAILIAQTENGSKESVDKGVARSNRGCEALEGVQDSASDCDDVERKVGCGQA